MDKDMQYLRDEFKKFEGRFDHHLEVYAKNGKELEAVKINQQWLMKFFFMFMSPISGAIIYLVMKAN